MNLVADSVVTWNTVYMHAVLQQLRAEGFTVNDADVAHLSPARFQHINPHGKYHFHPAWAQGTRDLRPLRSR